MRPGTSSPSTATPGSRSTPWSDGRHQSPVLYRRWSDRDELVRAAIAHVLKESLLELPDTGSLRDDLVTLMREIGRARVRLITLVYGALAGYHRDVGESLGALRDPP